MKKKRTILIIVVLFLLTFGFLARHYSMHLTLYFSEFDTSSIQIIDQDFDHEDEIRVLKAKERNSDRINLLLMRRNSLGFWRTDLSSPTSLDRQEILFPSRFEFADEPSFGVEWHTYIVGDNARKLIEIQNESIPSNVTVNVTQVANEYTIHISSFERSEQVRDTFIQYVFQLLELS